MSVEIIKREGNKLTVEITVDLEGSMLEMEEIIQKSVNELGLIETAEALKHFDTTGEVIEIGELKMTSKGQEKKNRDSLRRNRDNATCVSKPSGRTNLRTLRP